MLAAIPMACLRHLSLQEALKGDWDSQPRISEGTCGSRRLSEMLLLIPPLMERSVLWAAWIRKSLAGVCAVGPILQLILGYPFFFLGGPPSCVHMCVCVHTHPHILFRHPLEIDLTWNSLDTTRKWGIFGDACVYFVSVIISLCGSHSGPEVSWRDIREKLRNGRKIASLLSSSLLFFLIHPVQWNYCHGSQMSMQVGVLSWVVFSFWVLFLVGWLPWLAVVQTHMRQI